MTRYFYIILNALRKHPYITAAVCGLLVMSVAEMALAASDNYIKYCGKDAIEKKYTEAGCWSCDIVLMLLLSLSSVSETFYGATLALSTVVLTYGTIIWMAIFLLKSLASFATQDPARILDGALTFLFKVALVYALITAGIDEIVGQIVNPLLSIGMDIGSVFAKGSGIGGWTY